MKHVKNIGYPEINKYCESLGEWQEECRYDWMTIHKKQLPRETLLTVCQTASDCLFEVIDFYPESKLEDQLQSCMKIPLTHYQEDCQRFALQRTFATGFTAEDIQTFQKFYEQQPRLMIIDHFAGILQECSKDFICSPPCTRSAKQVQQHGCPPKRIPKPWVWSENKSDPVQHHDE